MGKDKKIKYNDEIDIVYNGIVWVVWKNGKMMAYGFTEHEAREYAREYATYKGE